jgi:hypothetical protein
MPAHSRSKNGVASLAYVAGIHVLDPSRTKDLDGRNESGDDAPEQSFIIEILAIQ